MAAFIGPLLNSGDQQVAELQAALAGDALQSDEEDSFHMFPDGHGYGRGYDLMNLGRFLQRPMRSYYVTVGNHRVHFRLQKKRFIIRNSPPTGAWLQKQDQ